MIQLIVVILLVFVFIIAQLRIYVTFWQNNLDVDLEFENTEIFEGEEGVLKEIIVNDKWLPLPMFHVKFQASKNLIFPDSMETQKTDQYYRNDIFSIGRHEKIVRRLPFIANKRGLHRINNVDLISGDLLMIATVRKSFETDKFVYVYPSPYYSKEVLHSLQMVNGLVNTRRQFMEDPFEYRGIREYQPYDDMKSINWKATAKTGDFKVNLKDFTAVKSVRIFLNLQDEGIRKKRDEAEVCIRLAAGITRYFSQKNISIACYGNCKDSRTGQILFHNPDRNYQEIYRSLACIDLEQHIQAFEKHFDNRLFAQTNGEYTFIISMNAYEEFLDLLQRYSTVSEDFLWFYPMDTKREPDIPWNLQKYFKSINISHVK